MHPMTLSEILYQSVINRTWWEQVGIRKEVKRSKFLSFAVLFESPKHCLLNL